MADQDPPVGPLRRLDPSEPDETQDLGRLEPLDPQADELGAEPTEAVAPVAPVTTEAAPQGPRLRDGLAPAIALAILLSLSSMAAIGGLVAISVSGLDQSSEVPVTAPIESAAPGPTIRVVQPADEETPRGREAPRRSVGESASPADQPSSPPAPAPAPAPAPGGSQDDGKGDKAGDKDGDAGRIRAPKRLPGWCDASPGTSCDIAPRTGSVDLTGFVRTEDDVVVGEELDDEADGSPGRGHDKDD